MARQVSKKQADTVSNIITTSYSAPFKVARAKTFSVQGVITVDTPAAKVTAAAAVDVTANTLTAAAHGFTTGLKGQFTTSVTLPSGLSLATDYFVIVIDANTYKVATSLANALAGTPVVDITTQGTGNHTFTPTAIAGATFGLQKSNDYNPNAASSAHWDIVAAATAVTVTANVWLEVTDPSYEWVRYAYAITAGRMSTVNNVLIKEEL